jgi:hypothetical protein
MTNDEKYPRWLNGHGCIYGQNLAAKFETWRENLKEELKEDYKARMDKLEQKLDRIFIGIALAAVGFATSAVLLAANLAF